MIDQSEILRRSHVQFITLFFGNAEKPISWAKPAHFDFFAINCTVCSHILSSGGDALRDYNSALGNVRTVRRHWLATWIQMQRISSQFFFASLESCPNDHNIKSNGNDTHQIRDFHKFNHTPRACKYLGLYWGSITH